MRTFQTIPLLCALLSCLAMAEPPRDGSAGRKILCEGIIPPGPIKPLVHAEIGGKDHTFIFDTGCKYPLMIDKVIGPALGEMIAKVGSEDYVQGSYALPEIRMGGFALPASERPGVEMDMFKKVLGIPLHGFIGWPALADHTLFLDHDHNKFEIIQGDWRLSPDSVSVPLIEEDDRPFLKLTLGDSEMKFLIDTGSDSGIVLNDENYDRLVQQGFIHPIGDSQKVLKSTGVYAVRNGSFLKGSILGIDLKGFPVNTNPRIENLLGELLLSKLNISISRSALRFDYKIRSNPEKPVSTDLMLGAIFIYQKGSPSVFRLKDGGTAQTAGLQVGDVISSIGEIGDRPMNSITMNALCREKAGQTIHLKITRDGVALEKEMKLPTAISRWN